MGTVCGTITEAWQRYGALAAMLAKRKVLCGNGYNALFGQPVPSSPRILVVHGNIYGLGGAEIYCVRVLELLQRRYDDITLVHFGGPLDARRIADWSGIRLDPARIRFVTAATPFGLPRQIFSRVLLAFALALRAARRLAPFADLVICTYCECPIKHPRLLQTILAPIFGTDRESLRYLGIEGSSLYLSIRAIYVRLCRFIAGWDRSLIGSHATIAISEWTAAQFTRLYGAAARVVYMGAKVSLRPGDPEYLQFDSREDNFIIIGRAVPAKRIETAIAIVERLRQRGHALGLHIVGAADEPYAASLRTLLQTRPWAQWHTGLSRTALEALAARQKWGIHCYQFEHYGLAPAELQLLGCIVFVHDTGGQREVVQNPNLRYRDVDDAVAKIERVLLSPQDHPRLIAEIADASRAHQVESFDTAFLELVGTMLGERSGELNFGVEVGIAPPR